MGSEMCIRDSLALNSTKTKTIVLSTSQMSRVHSLGQFIPSLGIFSRSLERVNLTKLLGIHFSEHLSWQDCMSTNCQKSCHSALGILRKIVFYPLPDFLLNYNLLQLVMSLHVMLETYVLKIVWFLMKERINFHLLKLVFKALHSDASPSYLKINEVAHTPGIVNRTQSN